MKLGESSVSRRVEALLRGEHISIRTLVEPALLGLPVEALLWVQVSPERIDELGQRLSQLPQVRYLAAIAGDAQLLVDVTVPSQQDLYRFIAQTDWGRWYSCAPRWCSVPASAEDGSSPRPADGSRTHPAADRTR